MQKADFAVYLEIPVSAGLPTTRDLLLCLVAWPFYSSVYFQSPFSHVPLFLKFLNWDTNDQKAQGDCSGSPEVNSVPQMSNTFLKQVICMTLLFKGLNCRDPYKKKSGLRVSWKNT